MTKAVNDLDDPGRRKDEDGVVVTVFVTFAAIGAPAFINHRYTLGDMIRPFQHAIKEEHAIGRLRITIDKHRIHPMLLQGTKQVGGQQGFPCATLTAGNGYLYGCIRGHFFCGYIFIPG